jgi:hypothetical protein
MAASFTESVAEEAALAGFKAQRYAIQSGPAIGPGEAAAERVDYRKIILERTQLRVLVKRILLTHGFPPDKQEKAAKVVLGRAEVLSEGWTGP